MEEIRFGEKIKGFLVSPVETFRKVKDEDLGPLLKYFLILAFVFSILVAIISVVITSARSMMLFPMKIPFMEATMGGITAVVVVMFVMIFILLIIGLFISAAIIHIFVYIFGGRKGYAQTVKAMGYGITPTLILGWIPIVGWFVGIWSLIVEILGIRELQEMSTGKAVLAVITVIVLYVIIAAIVYIYVTSMLPAPYPPSP